MTAPNHAPSGVEPVFFGVTMHIAPLVADADTDPDYDPDISTITANVVFTPKLTAGSVLKATTAVPPTAFIPAPVTAIIDEDGLLKMRREPDEDGEGEYAPVRLLGNSPMLNLDKPLWYDFRFTNVLIDGKLSNLTIDGGSFEAPSSDTVVDLLFHLKNTGQTAEGKPLLAPSAVRIDGGKLIFSYAGKDIPEPLSLDHIKGEKGDAATVAVGTTTTGAPGSSASVTNSGSSAAGVFNFTIPQGATGATGAKGDTGPQGTPGSATINGFDVLKTARLVATTAGGGNGTENGANTWAKLATFAQPSDYSSCAAVLAITAADDHQSAIISVGSRNAGSSSGTVVDVQMLAKAGTASGISADSFKIIAGAYQSNSELWMKKTAQYMRFSVYELSRTLLGTGNAITYNDNAAWQSAVPTGAVSNVSTNGVAAFNLPVLTTSGTATVTNKDLSSTTNTFPSIITGNVLSSQIEGGAGYFAMIPRLYNDLAYCPTRAGGALTVTKNGATPSLNTDYLTLDGLFSPGGYSTFLLNTVSTDIWVFEVTVPTGVDLSYTSLYGISMTNGYRAKDVTIEVYYNGAWATAITSTNQASGEVWKALSSGSYVPSKIRYTLTNFATTQCRINALYAVGGSSSLSSSHLLPRTGGSLYGTNAAPPTLTASGADSSISINLVPKGSGTVNVGGVPIVTTTGTQALSNKTLTSPTINTPKIDTIKDTNGNSVLTTAGTANAVNYVFINNESAGNSPTIKSVGSDTNVSLMIQPQGTGFLYLKGSNGGTTIRLGGVASSVNYIVATNAATGSAPSLSAYSGTDANVSLNLASQGSGTVQANGKPVVTGAATRFGATVAGPVANLQGTLGWVTGLHNDLAFLKERGGSMTVTKNGVDLGDWNTAFTTGWTPYTAAAQSDVFVFEVTYPNVDMPNNDASTIGMKFYSNPPKNVKIEIFRSSVWSTSLDATDNTDTLVWVHPLPFQGTTKLRFTVSDFGANAQMRLQEIFSVTDSGYGLTSKAGLASSVMFRNGGNIYGTAAAPPTLTAAGSDANIGINLVPKGSGTVQANGIPIVTTTGTQSLSGKTISGTNNTLTAIPVTAISATGTPSASTYLRGDGTWAAASGGGYTLPVATTTVLGGVKQGSNVTIAADGTISAAVASVAGRTGAVTLTAADLTDSSAVGRSVVTAASAAAARTAIGATDLTIGTTASTACAGNDPRLSDARTPTAAGQVADMSIVTFGAQTVRATGTGDNPFGIKLQRAITVQAVTFRVATADASGNLVAELRKNGVAVAGTSTTVAAASQVAGGTTTGTWAFAAGDILTVAITGVGTTPGKGLVADIAGLTT